MSRRMIGNEFWMTLSIVALATMVGCTGGGLPEEFTFTLPGGETVTVSADDGVDSPVVAGSTWVLRDVNQNPFVDIVFDDSGNLVKFENSTFTQGFIGDMVIFDGNSHDAGIPFVTYTAQMFEFELVMDSEFAFHAIISANAPIVGVVAEGTADAGGTIDPETDTMSGIFEYAFTVPADLAAQFGIPTDDLTGSIPYTAFRKETDAP